MGRPPCASGRRRVALALQGLQRDAVAGEGRPAPRHAHFAADAPSLVELRQAGPDEGCRHQRASVTVAAKLSCNSCSSAPSSRRSAPSLSAGQDVEAPSPLALQQRRHVVDSLEQEAPCEASAHEPWPDMHRRHPPGAAARASVRIAFGRMGLQRPEPQPSFSSAKSVGLASTTPECGRLRSVFLGPHPTHWAASELNLPTCAHSRTDT